MVRIGERIDAIDNDPRGCEQEDADWLIAELRRAREALADIRHEIAPGHTELEKVIDAIAKRGLGE